MEVWERSWHLLLLDRIVVSLGGLDIRGAISGLRWRSGLRCLSSFVVGGGGIYRGSFLGGGGNRLLEF